MPPNVYGSLLAASYTWAVYGGSHIYGATEMMFVILRHGRCSINSGVLQYIRVRRKPVK